MLTALGSEGDAGADLIASTVLLRRTEAGIDGGDEQAGAVSPGQPLFEWGVQRETGQVETRLAGGFGPLLVGQTGESRVGGARD